MISYDIKSYFISTVIDSVFFNGFRDFFRFNFSLGFFFGKLLFNNGFFSDFFRKNRLVFSLSL